MCEQRAVSVGAGILRDEGIQGERDGQVEAWGTLAEAQQRKATPLTKQDIHALYRDCFEQLHQTCQTKEVSQAWLQGWTKGFANTCLDAMNAAPDPEHWMHEKRDDRWETVERGQRVLTLVTFRKAVLAVANPAEFFKGVNWGQTVQVEEEHPTTAARLVTTLLDNLINHPKSVGADWLLGYVLGRADALFRDRRTYPGPVLITYVPKDEVMPSGFVAQDTQKAGERHV